MASNGIRNRVAIVGMGCTEFGERWDKSASDLLVDAATACVASAPGLRLDDVDAFWLGTLASGFSGITLARALNTSFKPITRVENYCATGSESFRNACYGVASGAYDVVMAIGVEKLKDSGFSGLTLTPPPGDGTATDLSAPAMFAPLAQGYERRYGLTADQMREVLTHIAWKNHQNGAKNPRAQFRKPVAASTISCAQAVADPLGIFDCSGVADGAAAAIVTRADVASRYCDRPLFVKALACGTGPAGGIQHPDYNFASFPQVVRCAADAYAQAGIDDPCESLSFAEVHDCFTPTELVLMEDLGFSARGEAWRDVLAGRFDLTGGFPINPDGGLKSFGHPIGASGLRMLFECWLQLRGEAGERQIGGASLAMTHNLGGNPSDAVCAISIVGSDL